MKRGTGVLFALVATILLTVITAGILLIYPKETVFYNVIFQNLDGTIIKSEKVEHGTSASAPQNPEREGYIFAGWNEDFSNVTKDLVVTAEYTRITNMVFKVDTIATSPGIANVEVSISVANNPGILGMLLSVSYDETVMRLVDSKNGVSLSPLVFQKPKKYASGCNFVWYGSETGEVMDGEIVTLRFEIFADAAKGEYPIAISWKDRGIFDSNCDMLNPDVIEGGIVITE